MTDKDFTICGHGSGTPSGLLFAFASKSISIMKL